MAKNTYKKEVNNQSTASKPEAKSLWSKFASVKVETGFEEEQSPLRHLPFLLFLTVLGIVYIANNHYAENRAGDITKMEREVKRMQVEYSTLKYEYMTASTKESVAAQLEEMRLAPNDKPITVVKVKE